MELESDASGNAPHPKEAILHMDALLREKLEMLEKKLIQIRIELLGVPASTPEETEKKPEVGGFLSNVQERLHKHCMNLDRMSGIAAEVVRSLVTVNKVERR